MVEWFLLTYPVQANANNGKYDAITRDNTRKLLRMISLSSSLNEHDEQKKDKKTSSLTINNNIGGLQHIMSMKNYFKKKDYVQAKFY